MQRYGVDILPIKWEPARRDLGAGGSANVSQALINLQTSFAFKRLFHAGRATEESINRLVMEILILRHPELQDHANVVRLEAC